MLTMHQAVKVCSQVKLAPYSPFVFQIEDCFADLETNIDAAPITGTRPGRPLRGGAGDWTLDIMYKKKNLQKTGQIPAEHSTEIWRVRYTAQHILSTVQSP